MDKLQDVKYRRPLVVIETLLNYVFSYYYVVCVSSDRSTYRRRDAMLPQCMCRKSIDIREKETTTTEKEELEETTTTGRKKLEETTITGRDKLEKTTTTG